MRLPKPAPNDPPNRPAPIIGITTSWATIHGEPAVGYAMLRDLITARRLTERVVPAFALGQACAEDGDLECAVAALRQYRTEWDPTIIATGRRW